ncbi:Membrane-spanning 4-domains subfamily A member 12 [Anabarilius grahami]|uniref:Membrane-spanning 4-domains subfamily A member 12 n=1 Tax=Anabarilius grahami TaxID=495550 RepID=A0A3N0XKQ4_ANAGA|nr:Membrane-spanning 4-domains subfamily A member 12 [Anabarilius grahami]
MTRKPIELSHLEGHLSSLIAPRGGEDRGSRIEDRGVMSEDTQEKSKTFPRMETSRVISNDKATFVIQVNPQAAQNAVICDDGQEARGEYHNTALKGFFKAQPKALGTVQIMIGVMIFLLGIVLTANVFQFGTLYVFSGITYWGSFIYISAGSLSVAAQNKLHPCVRYGWGIIGIMMVLSILQFIISICLSGFALRATCDRDLMSQNSVIMALNQQHSVGPDLAHIWPGCYPHVPDVGRIWATLCCCLGKVFDS